MRSVVALVGVAGCLVVTAGSSAAGPHELYAWARIDKPIIGISKVGLDLHAPVTRRVAPGRYRLHVAALTNMAFHLVGPGIDRQTPFSAAEGAPVYTTWRIRLRRGRYAYSAEGLYAKELKAAGIRIRGALSVP